MRIKHNHSSFFRITSILFSLVLMALFCLSLFSCGEVESSLTVGTKTPDADVVPNLTIPEPTPTPEHPTETVSPERLIHPKK